MSSRKKIMPFLTRNTYIIPISIDPTCVQTKACEKLTNIVMIHTIIIVFNKVVFGTYISISKENSTILLPRDFEQLPSILGHYLIHLQ
jgi:hypothetical protein